MRIEHTNKTYISITVINFLHPNPNSNSPSSINKKLQLSKQNEYIYVTFDDGLNLLDLILDSSKRSDQWRLLVHTKNTPVEGLLLHTKLARHSIQCSLVFLELQCELLVCHWGWNLSERLDLAPECIHNGSVSSRRAIRHVSRKVVRKRKLIVGRLRCLSLS